MYTEPFIFVVTERQSVVRADLVQQLQTLAPAARIHAFAEPAQALPTLEALPFLTGAVTGGRMEALVDTTFALQVQRLGGWMVCLDERASDFIEEAGWHLLMMPFSTEGASRLFGRLLAGMTVEASA